MNYMCFDIGATSIKYGVAKQNGTLLLKGEVPSKTREKGLQKFIGCLSSRKKYIKRLASIIKFCRQGYNLQGIAISTTGVVDPERGLVLMGYSGYFPPGTALQKQLEQECNLPCTVENDANAAALGEYWLGAGRGATSLYCITVGTGIGGAAILNGKLIHGAALCAGEVGQLHIGLNGVWHVNASTWQLICNVAKEKNMPAAELNGKKIIAMAQAGDTIAATVIAKQMDALAAGIANICYILNPERVIVGGGISAQADYLYPQLDKALRKRLIPLVYEKTTLRFATLQNDAGMIGALYNFLLRHGKAVYEG